MNLCSTEPGESVAVDEIIAQIETDKVLYHFFSLCLSDQLFLKGVSWC
jgi:hypothetical protein